MSFSPAFFALVSHAQLSTATTCVFSEWILGTGGWQENQKPATQICHRLRNKAQLSERGTHPGDTRVHQRAADARAPFSVATLPPPPLSASAPLSALLPLLLPPLPSPAKYGNPPRLGSRGSRQPAPSPGSARSVLVLPQSLSPGSMKLTLKLSGRAGAEGAGSRRPGQGFLPLPSPAPQQVAHKWAARSRSASLAL